VEERDGVLKPAGPGSKRMKVSEDVEADFGD
jgi:hypothetical protein